MLECVLTTKQPELLTFLWILMCGRLQMCDAWTFSCFVWCSEIENVHENWPCVCILSPPTLNDSGSRGSGCGTRVRRREKKKREKKKKDTGGKSAQNERKEMKLIHQIMCGCWKVGIPFCVFSEALYPAFSTA